MFVNIDANYKLTKLTIEKKVKGEIPYCQFLTGDSRGNIRIIAGSLSSHSTKKSFKFSILEFEKLFPTIKEFIYLCDRGIEYDTLKSMGRIVYPW